MAPIRVKGGAVLSFLRITKSRKLLNGNPVFDFRQDESFAFPFEARYGVGNPDLSTDNRQFGFFVQDDWAVNAAAHNQRWASGGTTSRTCSTMTT